MLKKMGGNAMKKKFRMLSVVLALCLVLTGCAGLNFVFEFILNMVVAPALNIVMMHLGLVPRERK